MNEMYVMFILAHSERYCKEGQNEISLLTFNNDWQSFHIKNFLVILIMMHPIQRTIDNSQIVLLSSVHRMSSYCLKQLMCARIVIEFDPHNNRNRVSGLVPEV